MEAFIEAKAHRVAQKLDVRVKVDIHHNLWMALNQMGVEKLVKNLYDIKMNCYTDSVLGEAIFRGDFEESEIQFVQKFLRQGDIFLDIGANIGIFSMVACSVVAKEGKVIAIEPTPLTFERLKENMTTNDFQNIEAFQIALSNEKGYKNLNIAPAGYDAWNSFATIFPDSENVTQEEVKVEILDDFLDNFLKNHPITLIKIDVEGWEIPVLSGGKKLLSTEEAPNILVEFTESNARAAGFSCRQLYELLQGYGYALFTYDKLQNKLIPEALREHYPYLNLIATKNKEFVEKRINTE